MSEVLVIGTPIWSYTESVSRAFSQNGIKSEFKIYKIPDKYLKTIPIISKLYYYWYYNIYPKSYYKYCLEHAPDGGLLVLFGINYLSNKQLLEIKTIKKVKILIWFIDSIYTFPKFYKNIEIADYVLCYNKSEADFLKQSGKRAVFSPMAYDQRYYFPIENSEKEYDLYFIGTLSKRLDFFEELLKRIAPLGLRIRIDGPVSWLKRFKLRKKYPLLSGCISGIGNNHKQINELYNKSRLCLSIQPDQADTGFSTRVYEICGAGALQLTNGQKELLDTLFKIDTELLHFSSMEELINQIRYVTTKKKSPDLQEIADRGFRRALKDHTFNERVAQLLKFINN